MCARMSKYYEEPENLITRTSKNEELYKEIGKANIDNYVPRSNATVLGDNSSEIDIDKIKKILDTKYNDTSKRKSIEINVEEDESFEEEDTKEYDIKSVLDKAMEEKSVSYNEDRTKKLRDTGYDILKDIEVYDNLKKNETFDNNEEDDLEKLINTIAFNEKKNDADFDLLSDLVGDDNTDVYDAVDVIDENNKEIEEEKEQNTIQLQNEFYTSQSEIISDDFSDVEEKMNIFVKILLILIFIAFLFGMYVLIKTFI